jgi:Copper transport outer membrane protein, MctB
MINFRFHLASLVAIFLALALGVVIGAGVIDRGVVDALDSRLDRVQERSDRIEGENAVLQGEIGDLSGDVAALAPIAAQGQLANADVGIVAVRGVDGERVDQTVELLTASGASVTGVLWLESSWNLDDDEQVQEMAEAIGSTSEKPGELREQAWEEMAERMQNPVLPGDVVPEGLDDVMVRLRDAGFLGFDTVQDQTTGLEQFPGIAPSLVLVVGSDAEVPSSDVLMDAANAITAVEIPLTVGDDYDPEAADAGERGSDLVPLRESDLSETVSTVNDLDRAVGPITVTLAVSGLLRFPPVVGHYGIGGDEARLPELAAS